MNKNLLAIILFLISFVAFGQGQLETDSIEVRILNEGKHYIKEHTITLNGINYSFSDIWSNKYSEYQKLPYIWSNNKTKTTIIDKKMFKYDVWLTTETWPFDHIGDRKYLAGKLTIKVRTKLKSGQLEVQQVITEE